MTLKPQDMLEIQSAIDAYERKFPRRTAPTAEVALAWRSGKRRWARLEAAGQVDIDLPSNSGKKSDSILEQQECNRLVWAWEQLRLRLGSVYQDQPTRLEGLQPLVKGALRVGFWGVFAVVVASVFLFGAIVGGFK